MEGLTLTTREQNRLQTLNGVLEKHWPIREAPKIMGGETWLKEGDIPNKGMHKPLVDNSTFIQVQEILMEHDKHKQHAWRHKYLLRGLAYSLDANSICWAETHPKRGISYYSSQANVNGSQIYYNTDEIDRQLQAIVNQFTIDENVRSELREELAKLFDEEDNDNQEFKQASIRLTKLDRMEKKLQELVLEEQISIEDFKQHRARIEAERARLKNIVDFVNQREYLIRADFEVALQLATELDFLF